MCSTRRCSQEALLKEEVKEKQCLPIIPCRCIRCGRVGPAEGGVDFPLKHNPGCIPGKPGKVLRCLCMIVSLRKPRRQVQTPQPKPQALLVGASFEPIYPSWQTCGQLRSKLQDGSRSLCLSTDPRIDALQPSNPAQKWTSNQASSWDIPEAEQPGLCGSILLTQVQQTASPREELLLSSTQALASRAEAQHPVPRQHFARLSEPLKQRSLVDAATPGAVSCGWPPVTLGSPHP